MIKHLEIRYLNTKKLVSLLEYDTSEVSLLKAKVLYASTDGIKESLEALLHHGIECSIYIDGKGLINIHADSHKDNFLEQVKLYLETSFAYICELKEYAY